MNPGGVTIEIINNETAWHGLVLLWAFAFGTITPIWAWFLYPPKRKKQL